jgi:signal transduction histidine kinase
VIYEATRLLLRVTDNGCGLPIEAAAADANSRNGGFGLRGIKERADSLGGSIVLERPQSGGTSLEVSIPG